MPRSVARSGWQVLAARLQWDKLMESRSNCARGFCGEGSLLATHYLQLLTYNIDVSYIVHPRVHCRCTLLPDMICCSALLAGTCRNMNRRKRPLARRWRSSGRVRRRHHSPWTPSRGIRIRSRNTWSRHRRWCRSVCNRGEEGGRQVMGRFRPHSLWQEALLACYTSYA